VQNLFNPSFSLPANASGVILPFNLRVQCAYDAQAQQLYGIIDCFMGNATNNGRQSPAATAPYPNAVPPNNLAFQALYAFSVAPLSGTTVEILELVVG
jgi:hypothetical protein